MLRLSIFGRFRAADALGNEIPIKSKKARALLAYLALPPGKERSREEVMGLLWSERGDEQARSSLRQALSGLRKELGENAIRALKITDEALALDPSLVAVEPGSPGDVLLSGMHISDSAFDEWLRDERLRHEDAPAADAGLRPLLAVVLDELLARPAAPPTHVEVRALAALVEPHRLRVAGPGGDALSGEPREP